MANEQIGLNAVFDVNQFNQGIQTYMAGLAQAEGRTQRAEQNINRAGSAVSAGFGAALGIEAVNAIHAFVNTAVSGISAALDLASSFEQLEFGIRALGAAQDLIGGSEQTFAQLFTEGKDEAEGYLLLLQDMAIPSIFTTQQLANVQRGLQVFGFMQDEALRVTELLTNMATAGNIPAEMLNRLAYAMGQVKAEGRLLATEVRQFANAGVPILAILSQALGKSSAQLREEMKEGLLTADVVMPVLINYLENFEGVTSEAQRTLRGLFSALQDIREISVSNFMQGLLEPVMPLLESIVRFFTSEEIRAGAQALGEFLGPMLAQGIADVVRAVMGLYDAILSVNPQTAAFVAAFAGGMAVLLAFGGAIGIISLAIGTLVTPFTLAIAALAGFFAVYATNWQGIADITSAAVQTVGRILNNVIEAFSDTASGIATALGDAASSMADFLGDVVNWGSEIVSALAEGISAAVGLVFDAISTLASAVEYLLSPGSPPRALPEITEWGKATANEWLKGWTEADYDILSDIGNFVEQALKFEFGENHGAERTTDLIVKTNQAIAQAIDSIREFGQVSQETYDSIRKSAGDVSVEIIGYIERYQTLATATNAVEDAQNRLNEVTEKYDKLISPLQGKLDAASEAAKRAQESLELKGLERLLNTSGVSDTRKDEARARIQQILARQQIATLEAERDLTTDKIKAELDAATKIQEAAETELDLFQRRLQFQTESLGLLEAERKALERSSEAREKALKKELTPLERQLKLIQLQQAELADLIKGAKARKVLEDGNATAAQKAAAAMELQEISVRQQLRDIEAAELGGTLDAIRQIAIVAADLEKPSKDGKGKLDDIASAFEVLSDADPLGRLEEFRKKVDDIYKTIETLGVSIETTARQMNENLPAFLQFLNPPGVEGPGPLWSNLLTILTGFASYKFAAVTAGLLGLGPAGAVAAVGIGAFTAAYAGDWFGMQEKVGKAVDFIKLKLGELAKTELYQTIKSNIEGIFTDLASEDSEIIAKIEKQVDLILGDIHLEGLSIKNLESKVEETLASFTWDNITPTTFQGLIDIIPEMVGAAVDQVGETIGRGAHFLEANFPELDFARIAAGLGKGLVTLIINAFTGIDIIISELIDGMLAATSDGARTEQSLVRRTVSALTQSVLGAIAGIIAGGFELLKPENILIYLKTTGKIIQLLGTVLDDVVTGIFDGVQATLEQLFGKTVAETLNSIFATINAVIESVNEQTAKLKIAPIPTIDKIPVPLSADQFEVIASERIRIDLVAGGFFDFTGQQLLDAAELFSIDGQTKVSLPAEAVFAINPSLRKVIPPEDLIEIDGAHRILLEPLQLAALQAGSPIQIAPGEVFSLDLTKPIYAQIPITPDIQIDEVFTSISDHLRTEGALQTAAREAAITFSSAFSANAIAPPKINTGDPALNVAGTAAGLQFVQGFTSLPPEIQKQMISMILTLPVDEGAALLKAGFDTKEQFVNGFKITEENITAAKEAYKLLGDAAIEGVDEGMVIDAERRKSFMDKILEINDAMMDAAEAESPSELTRRTVGKAMGEGVVVGAGEALAALSETFTAAIDPIIVYMTTVRTAETTSWTTFKEGLQTLFGELYLDLDTKTANFSISIQAKYTELRTALAQTAVDTATDVTTTFNQLHVDVEAKLTEIVGTVNQKLMELLADIQEKFIDEGDDLGEDFGQGIADGILAKAEEIADAAVQVVRDAMSAAEEELDAQSPAGETERRLGEPFGQGTAKGILATIPQAIAAATQMVDSMLAGASNMLYAGSDGRYTAGATSNVTTVNHYHLNVQSEQPSKGIVYDFGVMELLKST